MKNKNKVVKIGAFAAIIAIAQFFSAHGQVADAIHVTVRDQTFISGEDEHTIALWLFDETPYNNVTLTDAGPFQLDLRLNTGAKVPASVREGRRGLLPGRYGGALYLPMGDNTGVSWAEVTWISKVGTSRLLDRRNEVPEICNLGYLDYTIEFWFKTDGDQNEPGVVWEVRKQEKQSGGYTPMLAVTAHAMKGDRERCLKAGFDGYVCKPIRIDELLDTVEAIVPPSYGTTGKPPRSFVSLPMYSSPFAGSALAALRFPMIAVRILLKSCATPADSSAIVSSFSRWSCSVSSFRRRVRSLPTANKYLGWLSLPRSCTTENS